MAPGLLRLLRVSVLTRNVSPKQQYYHCWSEFKGLMHSVAERDRTLAAGEDRGNAFAEPHPYSEFKRAGVELDQIIGRFLTRIHQRLCLSMLACIDFRELLRRTFTERTRQKAVGLERKQTDDYQRLCY